ncbi:DUF3530 family protein [Shewanella sp. YIC-542]|uniref:DUF3530 family protein n=1 Tax=Shewanella mytili TaxID=3377111 RepID=UPI00398E6961
MLLSPRLALKWLGTMSWLMALLYSNMVSSKAAPLPPLAADNQQPSQIQIDGKGVLVLTREWQYRLHRGSVIIIPPPGTDARAQGLPGYLARQLSVLGWSTFSLTPPPAAPKLNFTTSVAAVNEAGNGQMHDTGNQLTRQRSDGDWQQLQQRQQHYLQQGLAQLQTSAQAFTGKQLLVAIGPSGPLLMQLLQQQQLQAPDLLVLINPYTEPTAANDKLAALLGQLAFPVLDIQSPDANPASLGTRQQRLQVLESHPERHSRQQLLALDLTQQSAYERCLQLINQMGSAMLPAPALMSPNQQP